MHKLRVNLRESLELGIRVTLLEQGIVLCAIHGIREAAFLERSTDECSFYAQFTGQTARVFSLALVEVGVRGSMT